jgi:hypothetical protein
MKYTSRQQTFIAAASAMLLLMSSSAFAFRCGQKIVKENMHEAQVRKVCGAPATARDIGVTTRSTYIPVRRSISGGITTERFPGYGHFVEEVVLTEYVYNFGPRKLMRRLVFEGGILVKIETIGYGYRESKSQ